MDPVVILQWNIQSMRRKKHDLVHLINKFRPSVIAISETWLIPGSRFRIPGYSCLRDDRADGYAGSALLIERSLSFSQIILPSHPPDINIVGVRSSDISYISLYIPHPNSSLIPDILVLLSSIPPPIMIMGDFNAHHVLWGSSHSDLFGLSLLDIFNEIDLCLVNDGSPTRRVYPSQNPKSAVDLSLCSPFLSSLLSWRILPSTYGSDHFPIIITIPNRVTPYRNPCPSMKYKLSCADWSSFSSCLDQSLDSSDIFPLHIAPFISYTKFVDCIISSANIHIPTKKPSKHYKISTPWWDSECSVAALERKNAEINYCYSMTDRNFIKFQQAAAKFKRLVSKRKKLGWLNFCKILSPRTPSSLVWKQIRRFRGSCNIENISANDSSSWLEAFSDKLAPPFVPSLEFFPLPPSFLSSSDCFDQPFSLSELSLALDGLTDSAPGIDGIPYSFLAKSSEKCKRIYLDLVNYFFDFGIVPDQWKSQIIIPILKPGKDPSDPSSRRPIALSSVLCKITEHLIKHRLEWFVENNSMLANTQFGFRKGYSTMDSLSILSTDLYISFKEKKYLVGVFLDVSAAYDNVLLPVLKTKLLHLNIPVKLVRFICNMLMERSVIVKSVNHFLPAKTVWKGLPQGSVLSPLLYSLYTYDLERSVDSFCQILQYADDLALYVQVYSIEEASQKLNSALSYLGEWLLNHGLSLSASKSSVVVFSKKRIIPRINLLIDQETIPQLNYVKFLGVKLDCRMSGTPHFDYIAEKCEKNVNILRSLSGVWWGSHPYSQKLLYNAIIRSHFDYGSFLLNLCNKSGQDKMFKIQSKCLRIILGAMKSSPINAMQVECGEPPLNLRRQFLSDRFIFKLIQNSNHPLLPKLNHLLVLYDSSNNISMPCTLQSFLKFTRLPNVVYQFPSNPLYLTSYEALIFVPNIMLHFGIDKDSPNARAIFNGKINMYFPNWHIIFTDASKLSSDSVVGAAVWIPYFKICLSFKCPPFASVFSGEALALLEAILYVKSHNLNNSIIFSDSKSCLQAILSNPFRSTSRFPLILKIKQVLFECHNLGVNIILAWIPGHSGIPGNESVDSWAKHASQIGSLEHFKVYSHDLCLLPKKLLHDSWSDYWASSKKVKGKYYGEIQPDIPHVPWFFIFRGANKTTTSIICRLRLGHSCTPVHLAKLRIRDHSRCECDQDEGDVDHIFFNCSKLRHSLYDILPSKVARPLSFKSLLSLIFTPLVNFYLCKFISNNKIKL